VWARARQAVVWCDKHIHRDAWFLPEPEHLLPLGFEASDVAEEAERFTHEGSGLGYMLPMNPRETEPNESQAVGRPESTNREPHAVNLTS